LTYVIVTTSKRPDLIETTARWRWDAFLRKTGQTFEETLEAERRGASTVSLMPQIMVLLAGGEPVGMAALAESDLDTRPDLTPWLAGVFVVPNARGQGHGGRLVTAVEGLASAASIPTLWLYTRTAEALYLRAGWRTVERFKKSTKRYALMRRDLGPPVDEPPYTFPAAISANA